MLVMIMGENNLLIFKEGFCGSGSKQRPFEGEGSQSSNKQRTGSSSLMSLPGSLWLQQFQNKIGKLGDQKW